MEGENKTADSLLESVTNTSSALSQLHEQQQQSKHRHEQEYTAVEEGDDQNGQQEGYTEEEKIELLEETIQDLRDRLSRATEVVREYGKIAVEGAAARAQLLEEINMLRMQNIAGRRGLYDVLSTQYQHSSDFKGLSFGGDASKRRKGNNGVTAEAIQDEGTTSNDAKDQEIERLRKELQVKKNSEAKLVETLDSVSSKVSSLKNSNNSLKAKLSSYERENLSLKDKVTAVEGEKEALSQQLTALKEDDEELEGYQEVVTRQSASVVNKWKHACHSLSEEKRQLEEQAKEQDDYIEQIENQIQNVQSKYEAAKQKIKKLREEKSELETKNEELQASMKESSGAITHEKETLDSFKEILLDIQRQINSKASVESITRSINSADRIQQEAEKAALQRRQQEASGLGERDISEHLQVSSFEKNRLMQQLNFKEQKCVSWCCQNVPGPLQLKFVSPLAD
eukprot:gb/GECG01012577.1/.p1 GENE.gb/GECG01012577.1/~~gb/GECG01012577.1/.p1  ORF type:complete len:455 (+),score=106.05 gb/GECG01012577.1/:1-1365(+)